MNTSGSIGARTSVRRAVGGSSSGGTIQGQVEFRSSCGLKAALLCRGSWKDATGTVSCQNLPNHFAVDIREPALDAIVVESQSRVIQTQQMKQRGVQVVDGAGVLDRLVTKFVGGAVAEPAFHARAGQPDGEPVRVVVAAAGALLKGRHPAEFR